MIDHMQDIVTSSMAVGADGNMNFQMASGAVEAGVKIYSSRVDSVATEAYKVLGVPQSASDAEVKKAYRRLTNQHHPDKLVAKGMPEEMVKLANEKTQEIRRAWERIRDHRKAQA